MSYCFVICADFEQSRKQPVKGPDTYSDVCLKEYEPIKTDVTCSYIESKSEHETLIDIVARNRCEPAGTDKLSLARQSCEPLHVAKRVRDFTRSSLAVTLNGWLNLLELKFPPRSRLVIFKAKGSPGMGCLMGA